MNKLLALLGIFLLTMLTRVPAHAVDPVIPKVPEHYSTMIQALVIQNQQYKLDEIKFQQGTNYVREQSAKNLDAIQSLKKQMLTDMGLKPEGYDLFVEKDGSITLKLATKVDDKK